MRFRVRIGHELKRNLYIYMHRYIDSIYLYKDIYI